MVKNVGHIVGIGSGPLPCLVLFLHVHCVVFYLFVIMIVAGMLALQHNVAGLLVFGASNC